jgi:hypothetical protein
VDHLEVGVGAHGGERHLPALFRRPPPGEEAVALQRGRAGDVARFDQDVRRVLTVQEREETAAGAGALAAAAREDGKDEEDERDEWGSEETDPYHDQRRAESEDQFSGNRVAGRCLLRSSGLVEMFAVCE